MVKYVEVPVEANPNKMIEALLNYLVNEGKMVEVVTKGIVDEGMKEATRP